MALYKVTDGLKATLKAVSGYQVEYVCAHIYENPHITATNRWTALSVDETDKANG